MRNIILEGFDGSGKSTLARLLAERYRMFYQPSEGKEKYPFECSARSLLYFERTWNVFDRHPIISNDIYIPVSGARPIRQDVMEKWTGHLRQHHLIIYCAGGSFEEQVLGEFDTPDYQVALKQKEDVIQRAYREWAPREADVIYRKTNDHRKLFSLIGGFLCSDH